MTRPIEEQVLSALLERETMNLDDIRNELDHDTEIPFIVEYFIRLGYIRRDEDTDSYQLTKAGRICITSVQNQHAPHP
jgi:hypothetical protein